MLGRRVLVAIPLLIGSFAGFVHANSADVRAALREATLEAGTTRIVLVEIPPGAFSMGTSRVIRADDLWSPCDSCPARNDVERPVHSVTLTRAFWIGRYLITQGQWRAVMGRNPSRDTLAGPNAPVERVSWEDSQAFLLRLNSAQKRWTVRLPTEAEWEYAARAGSAEETYGPLDSIAWYAGNSHGTTHPVGEKQPNAFGLYDMLGNVWEWCEDWFAAYPDSSVVDPNGAPLGDRRVTRGGCFYCAPLHERAARRNRDLVDHSSPSIGFRIVAEPRATH